MVAQSAMATVNDTDDVKSIAENFLKGVNIAKEQGPPSECEGTLLPPFLSRLGYIKYYENSTGLQEDSPNKVRLTNTMRSFLQNKKAPERILSLQATTLREIARRVNYIHQDKILFVKTTYHAFRIVGVNVLVEDDNGDCIMLSLYNYLAFHEDPSEFLPIGSYLAILAPLMKHASDDPNQSLLLRCDNPECVRLFPFYRSWVAAKHGKKMLADINDDPNVLRQEGNDHFAKQKYETAARKYSQALACTATISDSTRIACLGNRAEVNLRMERWEAAERDARAVLSLDPSHVKAQYRLARALLHLNQVSEAHHIASKLKGEREPKTRKLFDQLLLDVNRACKEQKDGNYNFHEMREEASRHGTTLFHANYTSPKIEQGVMIVKPSGFTYRGCIARETLAANTLVSASKAFASVPYLERFSLGVNPYTNAAVTGARLELENNIIALLHRRPELKEIFYSLSSGIPDDIKTAGSIIQRDMGLDMDRIEQIIATNAFGIHMEESTKGMMLNLGLDDQQHLAGCGIWINESLFNHSCIPNCSWRHIGDHIFVETTRMVEPGEELCISYLVADTTFAVREEKFSRWVAPGIGFRCHCELCSIMRDCPELCDAEEAIHSTFQAVEKSIAHDPAATAKTVNHLLPKSVRARYLQMYSQFPATTQHIFAGCLWIMEGCCLLEIQQEPEAALDALKKGAAVMDSFFSPGSLQRLVDSFRIVGVAMACGYTAEARHWLSKIWRDVYAKAPHTTHPQDKFMGSTCLYALPWWHGSTSPPSDKRAVLTLMVIDVMARNPLGEAT